MTWLHRLNPTPAFPAHTGPYKVGTLDVEIPTSELDNPSANPDSVNPPTVAFRVFYPAIEQSREHGAKWIASPQREYISAYAKFLGANSAFAGVFSLIPQLLYYIAMPVHENAEILEPPNQSKQWPVMIFSHGLGGTRNAYSQICGSMASHGLVVVAPDHRDGSSPLAIYHTPAEKEKTKRVEYRRIAHQASTEVYEARDEQLRIRLTEIGLIHSALLKTNSGQTLSNVAPGHSPKTSKGSLAMFSNLLNIQNPGSIIFGGHSFGACTVVQFVKSIYHRPRHDVPGYKPLYKPREDCSIVSQITPSSPLLLFDLWTLPIQSPSTAWLRNKPMPSYDSPRGGSNIISIVSEAFYKWTSNYNQVRSILSRPTSSSADQPSAHIFYPISSAHLSQSDFGVLFPWVTTKLFGAREPERVLRLNVRAALQVLREGGVNVAKTSRADLELEGEGKEVEWDAGILSKEKGQVRDWVCLNAEDGQGEVRNEKVGLGEGQAVLEAEVLGQVVEAR